MTAVHSFLHYIIHLVFHCAYGISNYTLQLIVGKPSLGTLFFYTYSMEQSPSREADQLSGSQESPRVLGTPRFITAFTSARHLSLSWTTSIQSMPSHSTSWRSILILSSPYAWVFQVVFFPQVSPPKLCTHLHSSPYVLHAPAISYFSIWSPEKYWVLNICH